MTNDDILELMRRCDLSKGIIAFGYIVGDLQYHEFAKKACPTLF